MLAMAGDEGLEPSYLDLETSVLAAGRISRKLMAELTGVEPVKRMVQSFLPRGLEKETMKENFIVYYRKSYEEQNSSYRSDSGKSFHRKMCHVC